MYCPFGGCGPGLTVRYRMSWQEGSRSLPRPFGTDFAAKTVGVVSRPLGTRRTENVAWFITAPLAAAAVIFVAPTINNESRLFSPLPLTLLLLGLFLLAETTNLNVEVRRHTLTVNLAEIPLVFALFYLSPLSLLAVRIIAVLGVYAPRRVAPANPSF